MCKSHRVRIRVWRLTEASAEGALGIIGLLVALSMLLAGFALGWW